MKLVILTLLIFLPSSVYTFSDQTVINSFEKAKEILWDYVYNEGGYTIYCNKPFRSNKGLHAEHIYPTSWMGKYLGCGTDRVECRKINVRFQNMESDLHNLYPALASINISRSNRKFGEIEGELYLPLSTCDFERKGDVAEPRPLARGTIARVIFYMHDEYGLPIPADMVMTLHDWNLMYKPTPQEKARNELIYKIQGTTNSYIQ